MATDLSNWKKKKGDEDIYQKVERRPFGDAANNKKQTIRIDGNKTNGDYTVSATGAKIGGLEGFPSGTDIPIFRFDATNDQLIILNKKYFFNMFRSDKSKSDSFKKLKSQTKIDILSLAKGTANTQTELNNLVRLQNLNSYQSANNINNQSPNTNSGGPPGSPTANPTTSSNANSGLFSNLFGDPNREFTLSVVSSDNVDSALLPAGGQYFRYPEGRIPNLGYDYIQISSFEYVASTNLISSFTGAQSFVRRNKPTRSSQIITSKVGNIIQLPMTGGLTESTAVTWNADTINELNMIAANIAYNAIGDGGNPIDAMKKAAMGLLTTAGDLLTDPEIRDQVKAYFAGQAASAPNFVQRATGKVINNNMELLFNGPTLRTFNFQFKLRPRTETEAVLCRNIIKSLKRDSAPKTSVTNMFLETPNVFLIEYIYQSVGSGVAGNNLVTNTEHPFMNKIKPCALTSINVNYTPDGSYMTYETNGSMVGYDLNLTFQEIEPIYRSDQDQEYTRDNMGY